MYLRMLAIVIIGALAACSQTSTELMLTTQSLHEATGTSAGPRDLDEERVAFVSARLTLALAPDCNGTVVVHAGLSEDADILVPEDAGFSGAPENRPVPTASPNLAAASAPTNQHASALHQPATAHCGGYPVVLSAANTLFATTNGVRVSISRGLVEFTRNDSELAFVLAHEMAHNLRGHTVLVSTEKRFSQELEADHVGFGIVALAGFDQREAIVLLQRLQTSPGFGKSDPRYPSFAARAQALQAEPIVKSPAGIRLAQPTASP